MTDEHRTDSGQVWFRVDTGTHTAPIHRLVTEPSGRDVFTAGLDKRVRRWDSQARGPRTTYVGEIGPGDDGRPIALAVHPADRILVVAVHRSATKSERPRTVLRRFDVDSGQLLSSTTWPTAISDLAFDASGDHLLCAGAFSLAAYDVRSIDTSPTAVASIGLDAAADRLALCTTGDGETRLFVSSLTAKPSHPQVFRHQGASLEPIAFEAANEPVRTSQMAVSDRFLALTPRFGGDVQIHDLDGHHVFSLAAGAGHPAELAFSPAGDRLIVGSTSGPLSEVTVHDAERGFQLVGSRRYGADAAAVGLLDRDLALSTGGLRFSIHAWPSGHLASDDRSPEWRPTGSEGCGQVMNDVALGDSHVAVGPGPAGEPLTRLFDLTTLTYADSDDPVGSNLIGTLAFHRTRHHDGRRELALRPSGRVVVTGSSGASEPRELPVERATAFTFLPSGRVAVGDEDGAVVVLDTDGGLGVGAGRTAPAHHGPITSIAAGDRWLATTGADQIVRLWHLEDLESAGANDLAPALNLFFSADDEWVIWSPGGYYAASQSGDRHIAFHVNRGETEEALVLPADRFLSLLYRPELIRRIWLDGDEETAREGLGLVPTDIEQLLPPVVEIVGEPEPSADGYSVRLTFTVADLGPATTRVWLLVDGLPIWEDPSPLPADTRTPYRVDVEIDPEEDSIVRILAEHAQSRSLPLEWHSHEVTPEAETPRARAVTRGDAMPATIDVAYADLFQVEETAPAVEIGGDFLTDDNAATVDKAATDAELVPAHDGESGLAELVDASLNLAFTTSAPDADVELALSRDGIELWRATVEPPASIEVRTEIPLSYGPNEIEVEAGTAGRRERLATSVDVGSSARLGTPSEPTTTKGDDQPSNPGSTGHGAMGVGAVTGHSATAGDEPGSTASPTQRPVRRIAPNLYVLAVGVSELQHTDPELADLKYAANDAVAITKQFEASREGFFGEVVTRHLTDHEATAQAVIEAMDTLKATVEERAAAKKASRTKARDVTLLFLSGHGITRLDPETKQEDFYFVSHDFHRDRISESAVRLVDLGLTMSQLPTELVVLIDACRSGWAGADFVKRIEPEALGKQLHAISERAQYLVSSTSHNQLSWESRMRVPYKKSIRSQAEAKVGHGLFTHAILKKLGETKRGEGVGVLKLTDDIQAQLGDWTSLKGWESIQQTPRCRIYGDIQRVEIFKR